MDRYVIQRKLMNVATLYFLIVQLSHFPFQKKKIEKLQTHQLRRLMKRAYEVPVYRAKFEQAGLLPEDIRTSQDLIKFPTISKEELKQAFFEQAAQNPSIKKTWIKAATSGSTGTPLVRYVSPFEEARIRANWIRIAVLNGFNPFTGVTMAINNPADFTGKPDSFVQKLGFLRRVNLSYAMAPEQIIERINQVKPDFLYAMKSTLLQISLYAQKHNIKIHHPSCYASGGEKMTESEMRVIVQGMGDSLYDTYGCTEASCCAFQIKTNKEFYHISHDSHVVHIYDETNHIAPKGRLILTNLFLRQMPIINFEVRDEAETFEKEGLLYVKRFNGRMNDWFRFSDGFQMNYFQFQIIMQQHLEIAQFRFIQEALDHVTLIVVFAAGTTASEQARVCSTLQQELTNVLAPHGAQLTIKTEEILPPDASGKLRLMVSRIAEK